MMSEKRKKRLCGRYICKYVCAAVWMLGSITLFFPSCERPGDLSGERVAVKFVLDGASFGDENDVFRSFNARNMEVVTVPLNDDLFMYAAFVPEAVNRMRADTLLNPGAPVRILAYEAGAYATPVASKDFTINAVGNLVGEPIIIYTDPKDFLFVAYAHNSPSMPLPAHSDPLTGIHPSTDLLLGSTHVANLSPSDNNTVGIRLHHVFARVRAEINTSIVHSTAYISGTDLNLRVAPDSTANVSVVGGMMTGNSPLATKFAGWTGTNTTTCRSAYHLMYPVSAPAVFIDSIRIGGRLYTKLSARFSQRLLSGQSYTLKIIFGKTRWAGSNVYWNGSKLTFDTIATLDNRYQGVYFKYGSLVGISPVDDRGNGRYATTYLPPGYHSLSPTAWRKDSVLIGAGSNFHTIPYIEHGTVSDPSSNYVYSCVDTTAVGRGDICRYISKDWITAYRLPVPADFGADLSAGFIPYFWNAPPLAIDRGWVREPVTGGFAGITVSVDSISAAGRFTGITSGGRFGAFGGNSGIFFPASGMRDGDPNASIYGRARSYGDNGIYWSGSKYDVFDAFCFHLLSDYLYPCNPYFVEHAFSVRCIQDPLQVIFVDWDTDTIEEERGFAIVPW